MRGIGIALLVMLLQASASGQEAPDKPNADGEIRQQAERYFDAIDRRDVKAIDDLLVDECLVFCPRGVVETKTSVLETMRKPPAAGDTTQSTHAASEVKVRCIGQTAVLTAVVTTKQGDAPGISKRRTLTWARQDGRWRLVHDQWSLLGDAGEAEFWSEYFRGDNQNFNRKPNAMLVRAVDGVRPGKALDVGMGGGRNAIYLAKQGWDVTGFDRAEGALAMARQQANRQGVRITPILQSFDEFDWGRRRWDLVALLYVNAVRGNVPTIRESLKPGGLVVIEAFLASPKGPGRGVEYQPGELRKMFAEGFKILVYEEAEGVADYGQKPKQLVRLVARRTMTQSPWCYRPSRPTMMLPIDRRIHARRLLRSR